MPLRAQDPADHQNAHTGLLRVLDAATRLPATTTGPKPARHLLYLLTMHNAPAPRHDLRHRPTGTRPNQGHVRAPVMRHDLHAMADVLADLAAPTGPVDVLLVPCLLKPGMVLAQHVRFDHRWIVGQQDLLDDAPLRRFNQPSRPGTSGSRAISGSSLNLCSCCGLPPESRHCRLSIGRMRLLWFYSPVKSNVSFSLRRNISAQVTSPPS